MKMMITPKIKNVRIRDEGIIRKVDIEFKEGLNIIVGKNASGKTTAIETIRKALKGHDNTSIKINSEERYIKDINEEPVPQNGESSGETLISFYRKIINSSKNECIIIDDTLSRFDKTEELIEIFFKSENQIIMTNPNNDQFIDKIRRECNKKGIEINIIDTKSFDLK